MITINLNQAREIIRAAESQVKAKPKLNISIIKSDFRVVDSDLQAAMSPTSMSETSVTKPKAIAKNELREQTQGDFNKLRIDQAKLSNTIFDEVQRGATTAELATLYEKIESLRPGLIELYSRTRYVERRSKL